MIHYNPEFSGSVTGTQAVVSLSGSFTGSGTIENAVTASKLKFSASFGLGIENTFNFDGANNQIISVDTSSTHFISGVHSASIDAAETGSFMITGSITATTMSFTKGDGTSFNILLPADTTVDTSSLLITSSISGLTQSFTKGDGSTYVNLLPDTASVDLLYSMSNGLGIDTFTFENIADAIVQVNTASAHFTVGVSASQAPTLTALSASLTTTDQAISASVAVLSGSASTSRDLLALQVSGAFDAVSASLTATDQIISSSVAALSASASTSRTALSASLTLTDQTISSSVAALSASASTARDAISASAATALNGVSSSAATDIVTNSASIAALSQSAAAERLNFVETSSIIGAGNIIEFTKGDNSTYINTIITSSFVKSVNGIFPTPSTGNVNTTLTAVDTGTSASMLAASSSGTLDNGQVWIISGQTGGSPISGSGSNGEAYIFDSGSGELYKLANNDQAENDARYVLKFGDTMTGALLLNADPVLPLGAATKQYVDALSGSASTARDTAALQVSGAFDAVSASLTTTDQTISSSVAALSASASTSRTALSASLTTTDQTISSSVASLSASAAAALTAQSASNAIDFVSESIYRVQTGSFVTTASISGLTQSFTKGDGSTFDINLPDTGAVDLAFEITGGLGIEPFTFDNTADATVQVDTSSFHVANLTASLLLTASNGLYTMSFTKGDSSTFNVPLSASKHADTASIVTGMSYRENVTGATTYTITHNLDEQYPIVQSYDTATNVMVIPSEVTASNANALDIKYASAFTGIVVVQK